MVVDESFEYTSADGSQIVLAVSSRHEFADHFPGLTGRFKRQVIEMEPRILRLFARLERVYGFQIGLELASGTGKRQGKAFFANVPCAQVEKFFFFGDVHESAQRAAFSCKGPRTIALQSKQDPTGGPLSAATRS